MELHLLGRALGVTLHCGSSAARAERPFLLREFHHPDYKLWDGAKPLVKPLTNAIPVTEG